MPQTTFCFYMTSTNYGRVIIYLVRQQYSPAIPYMNKYTRQKTHNFLRVVHTSKTEKLIAPDPLTVYLQMSVMCQSNCLYEYI